LGVAVTGAVGTGAGGGAEAVSVGVIVGSIGPGVEIAGTSDVAAGCGVDGWDAGAALAQAARSDTPRADIAVPASAFLMLKPFLIVKSFPPVERCSSVSVTDYDVQNAGLVPSPGPISCCQRPP
jgi:hypothetical protein